MNKLTIIVMIFLMMIGSTFAKGVAKGASKCSGGTKEVSCKGVTKSQRAKFCWKGKVTKKKKEQICKTKKMSKKKRKSKLVKAVGAKKVASKKKTSKKLSAKKKMARKKAVKRKAVKRKAVKKVITPVEDDLSDDMNDDAPEADSSIDEDSLEE